MSTMPIENDSIPVKWSNIISTMSAGSRNGMHFSDTNISASNNYPEQVSAKLFAYIPKNNPMLKSNGKTFQQNIVPNNCNDNNTNGALSYISKNRKFCENFQTAFETNPKSTNSVAISHDSAIIMVTNTATELLNGKTEIDGNKYDFKSCSVPLQNLTNTDAFNGTSGKLLNCLNCEKDKKSAAKELHQVCIKCFKNLKKVCAIKHKGNMSRVSDLSKLFQAYIKISILNGIT